MSPPVSGECDRRRPAIGPRASAPAPNWDEENDAPPKQPSYDVDEDNDIRRPRWGSRQLEPHRGNLIMTLGILSIFLSRLILGAIVWKMASTDLRKMDEGIMDSSGRSQTAAGRTIGMVMVILSLVSLTLTCLMLGGLLILIAATEK